jgi:voltage-gated potassium channel
MAVRRTISVGLPKARFTVVLVLQFVVLFALVAFDRGRDMKSLLGLTSIVIPLSAIAVATDRKRERRIAFALAALAVVFNGGALSGFRPLSVEVGPGLSVVFSAYTTWLLVAGVLRSPRITGDVLAGALASFIMAGLAFSVVYGVIEARVPGAFATPGLEPASFEDLVYFSFVTLLTVGFGDVTPVAPLARAVMIFEGLFSVIFTTIVMASLVAGYLRHREGGA